MDQGQLLGQLIAKDKKFAPSGACVECGAPTLTVSVKCVGCLQRAYLLDEWEFVRERQRAFPLEPIEIATDRRKLPHLVLFRTPKLAWCGAEVSQIRSKRVWREPVKFPGDLCKLCLKKRQELRS